MFGNFKVKLMLCLGAIFSKGLMHAEYFEVGADDGAFKATQQTAKKYNLSICAIFKNEARYLKEWIEYHRIVGVDHFYLYNNNSYDRYWNVLKPYVAEGIVTLIAWPDYLRNLREENSFLWALGTQIPAYENAVRVKALPETKWLAFIDIGEFLIPASTRTLTEMLEKYDEYPGITFMSDCYDASRLNNVPGRHFLLETVELTSPPEENRMKTVEKTIFKPDQCAYFLWPPYKYIFKGDQLAVKVDRHDVRINRYVNRFNGILFFGKIKEQLHVDNRLMSNHQTQELLQLGYEIEDQERAVFRFLPEVRQRVGYDNSLWK